MKKFILALATAAVLTAAPFARADIAAEARAAAQKQLDTYAKGDFKTIFEGLPASYKKDISNLTLKFAQIIDPEVYNTVNALLVEFLEVAIGKSELIAGMSARNTKISTPVTSPLGVEFNAEDTKDLLTALKNCVAMLTLDTLKKGDVRAILASGEFTALGKLYAKHLADDISKTKITKVEDFGNNIFLVHTSVDRYGGQSAFYMCKVGKEWLPGHVSSTRWQSVKNGSRDLDSFKISAKTKAMILDNAKVVQKNFDKLRAAKTETQVQEWMRETFLMILFIGMESFETDDE